MAKCYWIVFGFFGFLVLILRRRSSPLLSFYLLSGFRVLLSVYAWIIYASFWILLIRISSFEALFIGFFGITEYYP